MRLNYFLKIALLLFILTQSCIAQNQLLHYTTTIYDSVQSKGYYFLFTFKMAKRDAPGNGEQLILDGTGHTVFYRLVPKASDFKLHPNGLMSYFGDNKFMIMDSAFRIVDSVGCVNGIETDNHDFVILPNGNYLLIGTKSREADLSMYPIFMKKKLPGSKKAKLKYGIVQELDKNKNLIYQWDSEPFFRIEDADKTYLNDTTTLDVTHFNSVDEDISGNILLSARYSNDIIKVNKSDGTVIWRLGGRYNNFKFVNDSMPFSGQHDARWLSNGHLTLFDNGYGIETVKHNARALEYALDETNMTATLVWSYQNENKIISEATGNMQRLANGNTLVNYGKIANGNPNITFEEVNSKKQKIISVFFADTIGTYRAFHYPVLPFHLKQPQLIFNVGKKQCTLKTANKETAYQWSTGETTREIIITQPGVYYVYVPYGDKGYLSSKTFVVTTQMLEGKTSKSGNK